MIIIHGSMKPVGTARRKKKAKPRAQAIVYEKPTARKFEDYVPKQTFRKEVPHYPSVNSNNSDCSLVEKKQYTGTLVKGISTMHKSNAVPIIDDEHAKDIARMRR